jgi:hypothetical protein
MHDNTKLVEWLLMPHQEDYKSVYTNHVIKAYIGLDDPYPIAPYRFHSLHHCFGLEASFPPIVEGYKTLALRSKVWAKYFENWEELRRLSVEGPREKLEQRMVELRVEGLEQLTDDDVPLRGVVND